MAEIDEGKFEGYCDRPDLNVIHCPVWQCGGTMHPVDAKFPLRMIQYHGDSINWQIPDLVCDNCKSTYHCESFEKRKMDGSTNIVLFYFELLLARLLRLGPLKEFVN